MIGTSNAQIAKDLDITRPTVAVILNESDIRQQVAEARSDMVLNGSLRKSVRVMRQRLDKGSESAATTILRGFNVLRSGNETTVNVLNNGAMSWTQIIEAKKADSERKQTTISSDTAPDRPTKQPEST